VQLKREAEELVEYLYRENSFPTGCYLLLAPAWCRRIRLRCEEGDDVEISIEGIGYVRNVVG